MDGGEPLGTLATSVYDRLRRDILEGQLEPDLKLRVGLVRERYQAGNSPVREALNRLSSDGLVTQFDQRGFKVAPVSAADLLEITKTRCLVEEVALRASIENRSVESEEAIVLALHRLCRMPNVSGTAAYTIDAQWEHAHRAFHQSLLAACGMPRLIGFCKDLFDQSYRYRQLAVEANAMRPTEHDEHKAIMEATIDGNADKAVELLTAHYATTCDILMSTDDFLVLPAASAHLR